MIMMPYGWTLDIAAAHRTGGLLAPRRSSRPKLCSTRIFADLVAGSHSL
jgi:hypothetical protein